MIILIYVNQKKAHVSAAGVRHLTKLTHCSCLQIEESPHLKLLRLGMCNNLPFKVAKNLQQVALEQNVTHSLTSLPLSVTQLRWNFRSIVAPGTVRKRKMHLIAHLKNLTVLQLGYVTASSAMLEDFVDFQRWVDPWLFHSLSISSNITRCSTSRQTAPAFWHHSLNCALACYASWHYRHHARLTRWLAKELCMILLFLWEATQ